MFWGSARSMEAVLQEENFELSYNKNILGEQPVLGNWKWK
jgi:hypothetical protein